MLKKIARIAILELLSFLAGYRLKPTITVIGITGSVGKTTAKEAVLKILITKFRTHANQKSFNSEFGVPLTMLEEESGYSSPTAWLGILMRSFFKSFTKLPVEKLILELGVDAPGNMENLLKLVRPVIGVVTAIAPVHLAVGQFASVEAIAAEKGKLIASLPESGTAILNADDLLVAKMQTPAKKITFGITQSADLRASKVTESLAGISAKLTYGDQIAELEIPILGTHNLYPLLAAITVGLVSGLDLSKCANTLKNFRLPPGRLNLLNGINGSHIIDGSYNANPTSTRAALGTLARLATNGHKIAVLGQLNELGGQSAELHRQIGEQAVQTADEVIGVHGDAKIFTEIAEQAGKPTRFFETAEEAGACLKDRLKAGDLVLMKGSQNNVRLEKAIVQILSDPADQKLLCRQDAYWQNH